MELELTLHRGLYTLGRPGEAKVQKPSRCQGQGRGKAMGSPKEGDF